MKKMKKMWGVMLVVAASACGSVTDPGPSVSGAVLDANGEVVLKYGDDVRLDGSVLRLSFNQVVADSRCPVDAVCVWAGDTEIQIGAALGTGPTIPRLLHLNGSVGASSTDVGGFRLTLVGVLPEARSTVALDDRDYSIRLRVEAI